MRKSRKEQSIAILFLILILFLGCEKRAKIEQKGEERIPVIVGEVKNMDVTYRLHRVGSLEAKESVVLKAEVEMSAGERVTGIFFEEGDWVDAGQLLVKLNDAKIKTTMNQLEARLRQLEIQLANRERTLKRKRPLVKEDLVSKQDFDDLETKIEIEKATIKEIKAQIAHSRELLKDTEIRAPFSGATSERLVSVGDFLQMGDPIVRVVQLNPLEISFRVDEKYKPHLDLNQPVTVTVAAYPNRKFHGKVFFISPDIDITTRTFLVKSRIANDENLLNPGMFAKASIITETHKDALVVPWESVIQVEDEVYLYLANIDTAKKVTLELGLVSEGTAEVLGELKAGQKVVMEGKYALQDGAKVKVVETGN
ncbi:MAG: efflux RND transporter periplasmic adaptor subunit [Deltaproteobacteria bacterium]|nr:efflux RND transporter periplasmic adaptor subunit [Deltaproteobacteria bacterium]